MSGNPLEGRLLPGDMAKFARWRYRLADPAPLSDEERGDLVTFVNLTEEFLLAILHLGIEVNSDLMEE